MVPHTCSLIEIHLYAKVHDPTYNINQDIILSRVSEAQDIVHTDQIGTLYLFPHYDTSVNKFTRSYVLQLPRS